MGTIISKSVSVVDGSIIITHHKSGQRFRLSTLLPFWAYYYILMYIIMLIVMYPQTYESYTNHIQFAGEAVLFSSK